MKTYDQLTDDQKAKARTLELDNLLRAIVECGPDFIGFDGDLRERIEAAFAQADRMRTPWFSHEYIMDTCRADLEDMARDEAEHAVYLEPGESMPVAGVV
jgi:hypothetical protein